MPTRKFYKVNGLIERELKYILLYEFLMNATWGYKVTHSVFSWNKIPKFYDKDRLRIYFMYMEKFILQDFREGDVYHEQSQICHFIA